MSSRTTSPAVLRSLEVGELKVSYVPDGVVYLNARTWLPESTEEFWEGQPEYVDGDGNLVASIGALLVEYGERAMLIDAGFGPRSFPYEPGKIHGAVRGGELIDGLARLGRTPEEIEAIAITHLHVDHVGWLWGDERPFAGAAVRPARSEWEATERHVGPEVFEAIAPQVRTAEDGEEIFPGVRLRLTPGHTEGHAAYEIASGGRRVLAFGDALHTPAQIARPELSAVPDHDAGQAATYRRKLVDELADAPDVIGFGVHFADVVFGRVERDAKGATRWVPVA